MSITFNIKQFLIGVGSGWVMGFITAKLGHVAALVVGGGYKMYQVAHKLQLIAIDWQGVHEKVGNVTVTVQDTVIVQRPSWVDRLAEVIKVNSYMASGFVGGFVIGLIF